jgi:hypothetical protein
MLLIKKDEQGYKVKHLLTDYSVIVYQSFSEALDLCRLRCHKILRYDDLKVIKVPFVKLWLVW